MIIIALLFAGALTVAAAETNTFDQAKPGALPEGWKAAVTGEGESAWSVVKDDSAPSAPKVLKQSATLPNASYPLCLKSTPLIKDGALEVKFKTVSGKKDQAAGLVWRAKDSRNYYICRANALEDNVVLYQVQDGKRTSLEIVGRKGGYGVDVKVVPATWQTLRVEFRGDRFKVALNGNLLFEVSDSTFKEAGQCGLWTKADSVTLFDDFVAEERQRALD
jgi:hypothetical protein